MEMERRFAKQPNKTFLGAALEDLTANPLKVWPLAEYSFRNMISYPMLLWLSYSRSQDFSHLLWEMTYFNFSVLSIFIRAASPNKKGFKYYSLSFKQIFA